MGSDMVGGDGETAAGAMYRRLARLFRPWRGGYLAGRDR